MTETVRFVLASGWDSDSLAEFCAADPKPARIDGIDLMANGRFRIAAVTFNTVAEAASFRALAKQAATELDQRDF